MKNTFIRSLITAAIVVAGFSTSASKGAYPESPISIVVPYAPGGSADALARLIAQQLGPKLKGSVVVVNKAGASGIIGASFVAQAKGDGYTLLYDATPLSINPFLQKLTFDPQTDLAPLTLVSLTPMFLVVPKNSPFNSLGDVIKAAKANPGKLTFASGGQGTVQFMAGELFSQGADVKMLHVPFKSGGPAITATVGGQVDMMFSNLPAVSGFIKNGDLKALAITSAERHANYPQIPTISESGIKGYQAHEWNGMFAPKGTSPQIMAQLQAAIKEVLEMPEIQARFNSLGATIIGSTPAEFKKYMDNEGAKWGDVVKKANITAQ